MEFSIDEKRELINKQLGGGECSHQFVTEEEFQNFMHRVTEVEKIVKKLASNDIKDQEAGKVLADKILECKNMPECQISEDEELKVVSSRTQINKYPEHDASDPNQMSKEVFMKTMEKDAANRAEERKSRNERADTYKKIGNDSFNTGDYEKAITYYGKAIEYRKDSAVIWNNRALSFMKLGLYEKALQDCEWALKVNESNIKALLNSAKCYAYLGNPEKRDEFIELAKQRIPRFVKYIEDFEQALKDNPNELPRDERKPTVQE